MTVVKAALVVAAAVIVLALVVRYCFTGQVPAGQPRLGDLTNTSLDSVRSEFNRFPDCVRIMLLLSPT
jgi:hypothetical protein